MVKRDVVILEKILNGELKNPQWRIEKSLNGELKNRIAKGD